MHKLSSFIFTMLFIFALGGFAAENPVDQTLIKPDPKPATVSDTPEADVAASSPPDFTASAKMEVIPSPADDSKTQATLISLITQAGWFPELNISVKNGIVIIKGKTKDAQHLEWLAKTADRLPAVVAVINHAHIETPPVSDLTPALDEFKRLIERSKKAMPRALIALVIGSLFFFLGLRLTKGIYSLWSRRIKNLFLLSTVARLSMLPVWVVFFYLTLQIAGLSSLATTIIGGTGALGIILGFAFKDIVGNYLSGILLAIRAPFTKGDEIQIGDQSGYVQSLNMRGTTILDYDGSLVLIPNATVIQSVIRNRTAGAKSRGTFFMAIGYEDSITQAQSIIKDIIKKIPGVYHDPEPVIYVEKLTSSMVNLKVLYWFDMKKASTDRVNSAALMQAKEALLIHGFSLPYPNQEIILGDEIKVRLLEGALDTTSPQQERQVQNQKAQLRLQETKAAPHPPEDSPSEKIQKVSGHSDLLDRGHHQDLVN